MEKFICFWEQEVDKKKVCIHIDSSYCGKKCTIKESKCELYQFDKIGMKKETEIK